MVSTGRLADNGIEPLFRRHDVRLILEADQSFIGAGQRNLDSGMYMLPDPQLQDLEKRNNFRTSSAGLDADNDGCEDAVIGGVEKDSNATEASFELYAQSRYRHREGRKPRNSYTARLPQYLSTPHPTEHSGVDFHPGRIPTVTSRIPSLWRQRRSASSQ